ncbi:MAG: anhydro-N-acetylmuramic acid kinase [Bacteroidia bacterium]
MDGLDIVACTFQWDGQDGYSFTLDHHEQVPYDYRWKTRLLYLHEQTAEIYAKTHVYLGHWQGEQIQTFIDKRGLTPDFVAVHGQTIFHQPDRNFTAQIGDGETLVSHLSCPLVCNFRNKDVALGGQGAPLVVMGEKYLFPGHRLFLNLGGFCNLTYGDLAFDVAPCNIVLNHLYRTLIGGGEADYDPDGATAAQGQREPALLKALDRLDYYQAPPPKSLGWEWVSNRVLPVLEDADAKPADILHTYCLHVARQIARAVEQVGASQQRLMVTGGGKHHRFLLWQIGLALAPMGVEIDETLPDSWTESKEAVIFAFLGLRTLLGRTTTLATATGARQDVVSGSIHLPPGGGKAFLL